MNHIPDPTATEAGMLRGAPWVNHLPLATSEANHDGEQTTTSKLSARSLPRSPIMSWTLTPKWVESGGLNVPASTLAPGPKNSMALTSATTG